MIAIQAFELVTVTGTYRYISKNYLLPVTEDMAVCGAVPVAQVLRGEDAMTYRMVSSPRGLALLIDNEDFETLPPRRGSHVDSACLARLFQQLGFLVILRGEGSP
jgi:hypothetical protein